MRFQPFPRATDCDSGLQYYTCSSSGYSGCCSVDACDYTDGCPDDSSSSASSSSETSTSTTTSTKTFTATKTSTISASSTTSTSTGVITSTSIVTSIGTITSTSTVTGTASSTPNLTTASPSSSSKGAVIGIIVALVIFCLLVVLLIWWFGWRRRRQRREQQQEQQQEQEQDSAGPNLEQPPVTSSPNAAGMLEKTEAWGDTTSPVSPNLQEGNDGRSSVLEVALVRLGLQGTWLGALCKKQPSITLSPNYIKNVHLNLPEMPSQTGPRAYMAELDAQDAAVTPELESPVPKYSSGLPQSSPALSSVTEGQTSTATCVSPWYSSGTTTASTSGMLGSTAVTPELSSTARLSGITENGTDSSSSNNRDSLGPHRPPMERPKATLNITPQERMQGKHMGSWTSYQP